MSKMNPPRTAHVIFDLTRYTLNKVLMHLKDLDVEDDMGETIGAMGEARSFQVIYLKSFLSINLQR